MLLHTDSYHFITFSGVLLFISLLCVFRYLSTSRRTVPFPPGPSALPIVGNIFVIATKAAWVPLTRLKEQFGDLVHLHGFGTHILVLNSMSAITDLLDKRGDIYSHRPVFTVVGDLMALGQSMPLLPYGDEWRIHRKLAHTALNSTAIKKYHILQEDLAAALCRDLIDDPGNFFALTRLTAGRIILSVTYGISVGSADDTYISHADETMHIISQAAVPGAFLCDLIPILRYAPSWVPFQRDAIKGRRMIEQLVSMPFEHVKRGMALNTAESSLTYELLSIQRDVEDNYEHRVKWTAGAMFGAGGETTYATILTFLIAMMLNPDKQRAAQEEIDNVIGRDRLPTIADLSQLPYVNAVIKETMRWHPVLPLGIARRTAKDDVYNGMFIPKDTIVVPNVWAVAFKPNERYPPKDFIPERFLDPIQEVIEPSSWVFGFGRRICPGRMLAENSVFILIAGILSTFNVTLPEKGTFVPEFEDKLISYPKPFACRISLRSAERAEQVRLRAGQSQVQQS